MRLHFTWLITIYVHTCVCVYLHMCTHVDVWVKLWQSLLLFKLACIWCIVFLTLWKTIFSLYSFYFLSLVCIFIYFLLFTSMDLFSCMAGRDSRACSKFWKHLRNVWYCIDHHWISNDKDHCVLFQTRTDIKTARNIGVL